MSWNDKRPMSPHLQIYDLPMTARLSILFRAAGVLLYFVMVALVVVLGVAAAGEPAWSWLQRLLSSLFGKSVLFLVTLIFYYHLCNGIRHLVWDTVRGLERESLPSSGYMVIAATVLLTLLTWGMA